MRVHMRHVRQARYCSAGWRVWMARHELDLHNFMHNGIAIEQLEAIDDHFAHTVCKLARVEALGEEHG
jgi:hypothetical protein